MDDGRKYDPVTPAAKDDIRPGFLGGKGGGEGIAGGAKAGGSEGRTSKAGAAQGAAADLSSAEEAASGGLYRPEGGAAGMRKDEDRVGGGFFQEAGRFAKFGKNEAKNTKGFKGKFNKTGPIIGIFMALMGAGGIMAGTQLFQPFSLVAQFQESFNSMHVSANNRSSRFFRLQMQSGRVKNPIKGTIFGSKFKITKKQQAELKRQGIEYDNDFNGSGKKVLKWTDGDGEIRIVTADAKTKVDIPEVDADTGMKYKPEAISFEKLYSADTKFFHAYNSGSMTWRGQFANWFGENVKLFLSSNKLTRNMWQNYQKKKAEAGGDGMKVVTDVLEEKVKGENGLDLTVKEGETVDETDDEGNVTERKRVEKETTNEKIKGTDVESKLNKISKNFSKAANIGCAVSGVIGAVSLMVSAAEALQIVNLVTSYMEAVDKTKAGYGDDAPIHELTQTLNDKKTNTNYLIKETGGGTGVSDTRLDGLTTEEVSTKKTAMEAEAMNSIYGNGKVNAQDPSVQSFNINSSMKRILGGIGTSMVAFEGCAIAKASAAVASSVLDAVEIGSCIVGAVGMFLTLGASAGACAPLVAQTALNIAVSAGIGMVLGGIISFLTPIVANALTRDLVSNLGGEDLGNALVDGALKYMGSAHRMNGGSLGTISKYQSFAVAQAEVVAEQAREERASLSPFDITSKNTFMGSIMTQMMQFTRSSTLMSTLTSANSVVNSSLVALTPKTSAVAKQIADTLPESIEEYGETCPYLASIGAIGDAFCNPYVVTDMATMDEDPVDVIDELANAGQIAFVEKAEDGVVLADESEDEAVVNVKVEDDSDLAKYIRYCDTRQSDFGIADQNIANELNEGTSFSTGSTLADGAANGAIGAVPVLGDVIDIIENVKNTANLGYIGGEYCVANKDNDEWNGKRETYQRFIEDQSLAESMGIIEKSAVAQYLEDYYEMNPLDESYEGQLARYSGLDKETVSDLLDVIAYYEYVDAYDPSERYAFEGASDPNAGEPILMDSEYVLAGELPAVAHIVYADVRNRSFVV